MCVRWYLGGYTAHHRPRSRFCSPPPPAPDSAHSNTIASGVFSAVLTNTLFWEVLLPLALFTQTIRLQNTLASQNHQALHRISGGLQHSLIAEKQLWFSAPLLLYTCTKVCTLHSHEAANPDAPLFCTNQAVSHKHNGFNQIQKKPLPDTS